jgi:CRISPR-associated protein Csx3
LDQERIFDACTHAILLTRDRASHAEWRERVARHSLPMLADLSSHLDGESAVQSDGPPLRGVIAGLARHERVANPVVDALVELLTRLFASDGDALRRQHLAAAPAELAVDLDRLAVTLGWAQPGARVTWLPEHLPALLGYLPAATPLAIYGRGPNWLHTALARLANPAAYFGFDVRLGWVPAQKVPVGTPPPAAPLQFRIARDDGWAHVEGLLPHNYIDFSELDAVMAPAIPPAMGVILSGKLPNWLYTSLAVTYAAAPWLAVYQPQLSGAVVVHSTQSQPAVGTVVRAEVARPSDG